MFKLFYPPKLLFYSCCFIVFFFRINAIKEVAARCPLAITEDLLQDLAQYKTHKDKSVWFILPQKTDSVIRMSPYFLLVFFFLRCDDVCERTDSAVQESQSTDAAQKGQGELLCAQSSKNTHRNANFTPQTPSWLLVLFNRYSYSINMNDMRFIIVNSRYMKLRRKRSDCSRHVKYSLLSWKWRTTCGTSCAHHSVLAVARWSVRYS